jgi:hypothetical protein
MNAAAVPSLRALLVEDSPEDAELMLRALRRGGYRTSSLRVDTREGLARALEDPGWDLVLADYSLPGFGGVEAARMVEASGLEAPLILVSGVLTEDVATSLLQGGIQDFILKENLARLCPVAERALEAARDRRGRRQAEIRLERFFQLMPAPACVLALDGTILKVNPAFENVLGLPSAGVVGRPSLELVHGEDLPEVLRCLEKASRGLAAPPCTFRHRCGDGSWRKMAWTSLVEPDGRIYALGVDLAEQERAAMALDTMARITTQGRMAAYIAHEINNPLAGIKSVLEVLVRGMAPPHPQAAYLSLIQREIDRIAHIVRTMVHVCRPLAPEVRAAAISPAFKEIENLLGPRCRSGGVTLALQPGDPAWRLRMDEGLLRQLLFNLVQNAVEASPRGGVVRLSATSDPGMAVLSVGNDGPPIPPEQADRVFEPGFTTKREASMGGLGLGLASCRSIVESAGGTLGFVTGEGDRGTVFIARIPLESGDS